MDIFEILETLKAGERQQFLDTIAYCDSRVTADEGIPAIIALEDLTAEKPIGWLEPSANDADMGTIMAASALLYTDLFEAKEPDKKYPAICFAMSAVAETCFRTQREEDGKVKLIPYSDVVGEFTKKK